MGFLMMKKHLFELVEQGYKTTTIRNRISCKIGSEVLIICGRKRVKVKIEEISPFQIKDITDDIVLSEGFLEARELIDILISIYGNYLPKLYLLKFHKIKDEGPTKESHNRPIKEESRQI